MNTSVENGDINGDYFYINSSMGSVINNHNYIDYTKKRYEIFTNRQLIENIVLTDGVEIHDMLPESALNKYVNIKYNN